MCLTKVLWSFGDIQWKGSEYISEFRKCTIDSFGVHESFGCVQLKLWRVTIDRFGAYDSLGEKAREFQEYTIETFKMHGSLEDYNREFSRCAI